ncbi:Hypothetical predicted protein [Paramuricea clavata]|nr:Hypothetical predicted protein [Paramuricea clavata]CAB4031075.1 Hypothetical predicted protein [Paramuricea clavata]
MKLLLFATTLVMAAYVAAKPGNQGPALSDEGLVKREEWSTISKTVNGQELLFGCDRRHTLLDDGKCWSYCGSSWTSGEWCYTKRADGMTKGCWNNRKCYHFVDECLTACTL